MKLKSLLALSALTVSMSAGAQTVIKPASARPTLPTPKTTSLDKTGQTPQYLYNVKAQAFLRGANNYMTRATLDDTLGYKFKVKVEDAAGQLYSLNDSVIKFSEYRKVFADGLTGIWVDNDNGLNANTWTITDNADGTFYIGNSAYAGTVLGSVVTDVPTSAASLPSSTSIGMYVNLASASDDLCSTWAAVSEADYEAFIAENKEKIKALIYQNDARFSLYKALTAAQTSFPAADFSAVIAVYDDDGSTVAQLRAAEAQIQVIEKAWIKANLDKATLETPIEITSLIAACNMDSLTVDNNVITSLWSREFTGTGTVGTIKKNTWSNEGLSDGTGMLTPFIENWNSRGTALSDQICHIDTIDMEPGVYKITANVRIYNESGADDISGAALFANLQQRTIVDPAKAVSAKVSDGKEGYFTYSSMLGYYAPEAATYAIVGDDGKLTFGMSVKDANYNWQAHKDYRVYYLGKAQDAMDAARGSEMYVSKYDDDVLLTKAIKDRVNGYLDTYTAKASTPEQVMQAVADYNAARAEVKANMDAWAAYKALGDKAKAAIDDFYTEHERGGVIIGYPEDIIFALTDYMDGVYSENVTAKTLTTAEVIEATKDFGDIFTGIDNVTVSGASAVTQIYSVNGAKQGKLGRGINIVRSADGTAKKVILK